MWINHNDNLINISNAKSIKKRFVLIEREEFYYISIMFEKNYEITLSFGNAQDRDDMFKFIWQKVQK